MSWTKKFFGSSIGRKYAMAASALFLIIFLLQHFAINFTSVFAPEIFNDLSHFMGTNPVVQFALQPILIFGVIFHFVMGFALDVKNKAARTVPYAQYNGAANASWVSRNMILTGLVVLAFMALHFYDFWIHEIGVKYVKGDFSGLNAQGEFRYYEEVVKKFEDLWRVVLYCISFVLLSLHLRHGFQSAFQSVGVNHNKYTPLIKKLGNIYSIGIPVGFIFIALFHFISNTLS